MATIFTSRGLIAKLVVGVSILILAIIIGFSVVNVWIVKKNLRQKHEEMMAQEDMKLKAFEKDAIDQLNRRIEQTMNILSLTIVDAVYDFVPERAENLMAPFLVDDIKAIYVLNENSEWFAGIALDHQGDIQALSRMQKWSTEMIEASKPLLKGMVTFIILVPSVSLFMIRVIILPITAVKEKVKILAQGNLNITFAPRSQGSSHSSPKTGSDVSGDEIDELVHALNQMAANLRQMIGDISSGVNTLTTSSAQLAHVARQMASGSSQTSDMAESVATAAQTMTTGMQCASGYSTEATASVQILMEAATEMNRTIGHIATHTDKAQAIVGNAVGRARNTSHKIDELGHVAKEVDQVTETITDISDQTNLLALNATIEAARAGEAGKGFAVVANEIKELAGQTTHATREIKRRIGGIQKTTHGTVEEIEHIVTIINDMNDMMAMISESVEGQTTATRAITDNISEVARNLTRVHETVMESAAVSESIDKNMSGVNNASHNMADAGSRIDTSSQELSTLAEQLKEMVGRFRL